MLDAAPFWYLLVNNNRYRRKQESQMLLSLKFHKKRQSPGVLYLNYHWSGLVGAIPLEHVRFYMDKVMI